MLNRVGMVIAFVSDIGKSRAFYRDVLGLKTKVDSPFWVEFDTDGAGLALHPGVPPRPAGKAPDGPHVSIGFRVDGVKKTHAALAAKGVAFDRPPTEIAPGVFVANFSDPDGNALAISGPA